MTRSCVNFRIFALFDWQTPLAFAPTSGKLDKYDQRNSPFALLRLVNDSRRFGDLWLYLCMALAAR